MKLLVTGASGFVGKNFIKTYGNKYQIYAIVRESSNVSEIAKYCEIFCYDGKVNNLKNYLNSIFATGGGRELKIKTALQNLQNQILASYTSPQNISHHTHQTI